MAGKTNQGLSATGENPLGPIPVPEFGEEFRTRSLTDEEWAEMWDVHHTPIEKCELGGEFQGSWSPSKHLGTSLKNSKIFPGISESSTQPQNLPESPLKGITMGELSALSESLGPKDSSRKVLLGIAGKAGSGKTALCNFLVHEYGAVKTSFADPLKKMLETLGLTQEQLWGNEKHIPDHTVLMGQTPRHAMQTLGTEWGRHLIHPDIWAMAWLKMMEQDRPTFTVIEDVRFDNEVQAIRKLGGKVIGVCRGPEPKRRIFWRLGKERRLHASEDFRGLVERNGLRTVRNDSTIEALAAEVLLEVR